jgi:DNA repair protein RecN (Recombination protein N)
MLVTLSIRDVVLIDRLDLTLEPGLSVLTGETGAGKSILLDALGLALGARADARLVRHGAKKASVTAVFELTSNDPVFINLDSRGIDFSDGSLVLRRVLNSDGRSKAFINDQPVGVQLLKEISQALIEVHGQFDNQRLLNEATHLSLLDAYGGLGKEVKKTERAHAIWSTAINLRKASEVRMEMARKDQEFNAHALEELETLDPRPGEESLLATQRSLMMSSEELLVAMNTAAKNLEGDSGGIARLQLAFNALEKVVDKSNGRLPEIIATLGRAQSEALEAEALLENVVASLELDPIALEKAEVRLFALRALGRKHNLEVDELSVLMQDLKLKVQVLEEGHSYLENLIKKEEITRLAYEKDAFALSRLRKTNATKIDQDMARELKPLKMEKALFSTSVIDLSEVSWGPQGKDKVLFQVSTNPGALAGPLGKISSGGELARFTLALKAVLSRAERVMTLIFDEVDSGVGGAVADAVGERLEKLACEGLGQVLVVTHSPQVAARGSHHWLVSKIIADPSVLTSVKLLNEEERKEEIARMLAGAEVTNEARAAADSLLAGAGS